MFGLFDSEAIKILIIILLIVGVGIFVYYMYNDIQNLFSRVETLETECDNKNEEDDYICDDHTTTDAVEDIHFEDTDSSTVCESVDTVIPAVHVAVSDIPQSSVQEIDSDFKVCQQVLKTGKNAGKQCGKMVTDQESEFCKIHNKTTVM
ncbi:MAG TPA: hypothetical protein V6C58_05750 [Allocoleopsis sp.]